MKKIYSINDLPEYSKWPKILLESNSFIKERNAADIDREFEQEKWGKLLLETEKNNYELSIEDVDNLHMQTDEKILAFQNNCFELVTIPNAQKTYANLIAETLEPYLKNCSAIVDLGCGYGSVILKLAERASFRNIDLFASDFSKSGIKIVENLAKNRGIKIQTGLCNFLDDDILKFDVPSNALFFTSYSTFYQKYYPQDFIKRLLKYKPNRVINFEPSYEHNNPNTLWGLLSRKYIEHNQYNLDILSYLKKNEKDNIISIEKITPLVHGVNPLLTTSIFDWRPINS